MVHQSSPGNNKLVNLQVNNIVVNSGHNLVIKEILLKNGAVLSNCNKYRFALCRIWDISKPVVMFIGLNPSTADANVDDPTIRRCINFAMSWGYGGIYMANLFSYRATSPSQMKLQNDPIGEDNDAWLIKLSESAAIVVAAWGNDGCFLNRSEIIKNMLPNLYCLKINNSGEPAHPLYLRADLVPIRMDM